MTQQDNESRKWLYDKFTESGLNVGKDYAEFSALMDSNEESRQWAFDQAQSMGLNVGADFGQFSSLINPQQQDEPEDANSVTFPISRTFSAGHEVSRIEDAPGYTPTEPQTPQTEAPAPKQEEDSKPKGLGLIFKQPESQEQTKAGTYAWKNIVFGEQQDQYGVEKYRKQAEQQAKERPSFNEWMKQLEDYSDAEHVAMTDPNYIPPTEEQTAERNAAITDIERRIDEHEARLKDYNARYPEGWKPATQEEADKANKEAQAINEEAKKLSADCEAFMSADKNEYYDRTVSARAAKKSGEVAEYSRAYVSKGWTYAQDAELRNMRAEALNIEDADKRAEALKAYKLKAEELLGKGGGDAFENYVQDDSVNMLDNDLQRKVRKTDAAYKRAYDRAAKAQEEYRKRYNAPHPGVTTHGLTPEAEQQRAEDLAALDEVQNATAERTALWAAKQIESRSARTIENYNEQKTQRTQGTYVGNTLSNLSSSFGQRITDFSNWDFGLSDLMEMSALQKAVEKADNGEALSEGEEILLNAAASNMAIQGAADLGLSFTAGQVTAEAVPFIIQMIVDPAAAVGKGTAAGVARYAMKRAVASGTKALASKAGRKALRFGSRAIGLAAQFAVDTASGAGVAANTGQGKVLAGMKEKQVGEIDGSFDDNGNFVYNGHVGDDAALAYIKSFAEWTIENQSERIGDSFIDPLEDVIKSTIGKTATKIGTKVAPKMTEKAVQVLSAIDRKNWQHAVKEIAERAHFNGIIGETAEEIIGSAEKNLLGIGDEPITWDSTKDTFLTMIPMQVMFGVLGMGGAAIEKIPSARKVSAKRSLAASMLGDRWQEIENAIDGAKEDNLSELLKGYMTDETMSVPERRAIAEYAIAKQAHIGVEKAKNLWREHDTNEAVFGAAYDRGYNELTSDEDRLSMSIISQQMMQEAMANEEIAPYLPLLQTDPSRAIAEMQQAGVSEESMRLAGQTVNAIRSAQGIAAKMKDESMARVETFNTQIDQFTHRDGNIYRITDRMGNPAYLREGNLSSTDNTIIIVTEDGKVQMSYADNWTASDSSKAEDVKAENEAQESAFLESEINRVLGGRIGEVQVGQTIAVPMQGGEVKQYVVAGQNESGNYELVDEYGNPLLEEDGKPLFVGMEQIQQMSDYLAATAAEAKRSEWFGENEPAEPEATAEEETEEEDTSEIRSTEPEETKNNTRYNVGDTFTIDIPDGSSIEGEITYIDEDGTIDVRYSEPVGGMTEETISLNQLENMIAEYRPIPKVEPSAENQQEIIPTGQGFFGKIYNQFKGEAKQAFDFLFAKKEGDLLGVFHRNDIGDIDLVWGDRTKNMGLEHIIDKHVGEGKDFANEREVALVIDDVINNGDAVKDDEYHFEIVKDGYIVSLRKSFDGVKKNWVVTSFKLQDPTSKKPLSNVTLSSPDINEGSRSVTPNSGISGGKVNKNSATIQENAEKNALSRIPLNESGQPDYVKADPETAWDALVERNDGDAAAAQQDADDIVAVKQARLNAVSREKAKKPNIPVNATDEDILNANKAYRQQQKVIDERIATAQSELNAWKRIAFVQRKRRDEAEIEAARQAKEAAKLREAEEAARKIAEETAARIEREKLHGVPDWIEDKPQDARQRGYRRVTGQMVERQTPDVAASQGKEIQVKFDKNNIVSGHATLVEASALQPSHIQGKRNPLHFLDEAQPKERTDKASVASAQDIAHNIRPEEITSSVTAYTGAPTVNARGEVIQGNNRSDALRYMWENPNGESAQLYKQYLLDHAEDFGLNREDIEKMQAPVLVNMLDVNDDEAIKLGQFTAANTESGGNERISAKHTVQLMGSENMSMFAQRLLNGSEEDEDASITDLINNNGLEVLKWMLAHKFITQTQYQSALEDGTAKLNDNAVSDLKDILFQSIFQGGSTQLETMFKKLPIKAQKAILATSFRDYDSKKEDSVLGEVQNSIVAFNELMKDPMFADAKNLESARNGIEAWKRQYQIDDSTGESYLPTEKFSNFALLLAATYKGESQKNIQQIFNELYDTIQGVQEEDLFAQDETAEPMPLLDAIKKVIKELLNIDIEYNGQQGSNLLGDNTQTSEEGQRGRNQDARSGEQNPTGERLDDSRRGTEDVGDGDRGGQTDSRYNRERQDNLGKTEGVKLSEEKDENGLSFVLSSEGTTEFGHIDDKSTLPSAPIKLSIGFNNVDENGNNIGYGLEHIKAGHGAQILKSGYSSVEEFVEKVTRNYKEIRVGRNRKSNKTFMLLQLHDEKHKQTIFVELSHDGSYWNVNSGGIFKNKYTDKNDIVWLEPTVESNASTDTTEVIDSPANAVEGETVDRGGNSSQSISEHKVTENSANDQTNSEENVEKNADGVEKLENDASNEQLTGIQKANAPELQSRIAEAEAETDTNPTEAQKKAGNYKKGHVTIGELDITIENPKGSTRSGVDENGNPWSNTMHNTYGYILGTEGVDGDHIDVFLADDMDAWDGKKVFIVDQKRRSGDSFSKIDIDGEEVDLGFEVSEMEFDEHKVMLGFNDKSSALDAYLSNYDEGWYAEQDGVDISSCSIEDFNKWIKSSHRKTKPFAEYSSVKSLENEAEDDNILFRDGGKQLSIDWNEEETQAKAKSEQVQHPLFTRRELKEGETCIVERMFRKNGGFSFTAGEKIESINDVAYIFKQLENASVENAFAVFVKDGRPTVLHVGMGSFDMTFVNSKAIKLAYDRLKPDSVFFVHNHPSGALKASRQDRMIARHLEDDFGIKAQNIIINTTSGNYLVFDAEAGNDFEMEGKDSVENEKDVDVFSFDKQVFSKNYDPSADRMLNSESIAAFLSSHRLGERDKINALILNNNGGVVGNVFLNVTDITKSNYKQLAEQLFDDVVTFGGFHVVLYGTGLKTSKKQPVRDLQEVMRGYEIKLLDAVSLDNKDGSFYSYSDRGELNDEGLRFRDGEEMNRDAEYSKAVENGDNETAQKLLDEKAEEVFKDSQVRDEEGKLLKVYHGTTEDFNAFDIEQSRKNSDIQGMFFSPWVEDAQGYGGNVRVFYLNSKKLADEQTAWKAFKRFRDTGEDNAGVKAREYLQSLGYDGVNRNGEEYIIFDSNNIKSADPITYDDNGDVIPLSERFNEETDDLRFRFIGEKGAKSLDDYNKGRRIDFLKYAKYLEKEGRSEKDIKLQTGWERGADGKWRYETPDDLLSRDNLLELANGNYIHHMLGYFLPDNSEFTEAYPELYSTHVILKELPEGKKGNYSPDSRGGVIQLAMPKGLAEAKKMLGDIEDVLNNGYSEEQKASAEALGVELNTPEQLEASRESILKEIDKILKGINETFVHEVQHAIQHIEGFANGGNLSMFSMDDTDKLVYEARKFAGLLKKGTEEEREAINVIEKYMDKEVESASEGEMLTQALDSLRESDHGLEYLDIMKQLVKTDTNYNGYIDSRFKKYFALAGEVEARNVTRRIDMTEDERNMSLASETEDVPRDEQIVRNGNDVSASIIEDEDLQKGNAGDAAREAHEIWTFNQRLSDWLAQDNLDWAKGKTRQEIFKKFGNEPEPLFYIHPNYLKYFDGEIKDNRVYCGKGYFIDHAANSHPEVGTEHYADIQNFLNNPDEVKLDNRNGRKSLIFIKKDGDYYMEIVSADNSDKGRIVFHKTMHYKHNKEGVSKQTHPLFMS